MVLDNGYYLPAMLTTDTAWPDNLNGRLSVDVVIANRIQPTERVIRDALDVRNRCQALRFQPPCAPVGHFCPFSNSAKLNFTSVLFFLPSFFDSALNIAFSQSPSCRHWYVHKRHIALV